MKSSSIALSIATLSLAMIPPAFGQTAAGTNEAQHMVPARAQLTHALDSKSVHAGDQFRATLSSNVHLNNGVELHRGDALVGKVVTDDTNTPGNSRLAIQFTEATLKGGKTVPVKATIVALSTPGSDIDSDLQPDHIANSWTDGTLRVDQEGVMDGVDLHSQIASPNSGVFVATKKSNVKIPAGTELSLAIAASSNSGSPVASGD